MERVRRPNRSDVHLPGEEEARLEEEARGYFDKLAPKRHSKPQRSEYSCKYVDSFCANGDSNDFNSEYAEFRRLEKNDPQKLLFNGSEVPEEFQETEYYKDLNCVDKQHHTTGTGFIKMGNAKGNGFSLAVDANTICHGSCKGNPATNDWIPSADDMVIFTSDKPKRSDN